MSSGAVKRVASGVFGCMRILSSMILRFVRFKAEVMNCFLLSEKFLQRKVEKCSIRCVMYSWCSSLARTCSSDLRVLRSLFVMVGVSCVVCK